MQQIARMTVVPKSYIAADEPSEWLLGAVLVIGGHLQEGQKPDFLCVNELDNQ